MRALSFPERLELVNYAQERLRQAGFHLVTRSRGSEACYYALGERKSLLRVAAHRMGRRETFELMTGPVAANLTFGENTGVKSMLAVETMVAAAIGRYLLAGVDGTAAWRAKSASTETDFG